MGSQVYIVEGEGLPPKLVIVDFALAHTTLFDIENRFESGRRYTSLKSVEAGVLELADPKHGPHDSAYLPGTDDAKVACDGTFPVTAPEIVELDGTLSGPSDAWELRYQGEQSRGFVVIAQSVGTAVAEMLAQGLAEDFARGTLELKRVAAGSYRIKPKMAADGFKLLYRSVPQRPNQSV